MENLTLTIFFAFIVISIALFALAIGWLFTGKSKIKGGMCGRRPDQTKKSEECGKEISCQICEKDDEKKS